MGDYIQNSSVFSKATASTVQLAVNLSNVKVTCLEQDVGVLNWPRPSPKLMQMSNVHVGTMFDFLVCRNFRVRLL